MKGTPVNTIWISIASAAGACIALQAAANGSLRTNLGDARYAAFFSICGTIATAVILVLAIRPSLPPATAFRATPWWNWVGGPFGAVFVLAGAGLTPKLGSAAFIAAVVGGQLVCALVLDHFGLMDVPQQGLSVGRVMGAALVFAGVLLVRYW
jgi:bacterial/archaeal transporter family-2 protein